MRLINLLVITTLILFINFPPASYAGVEDPSLAIRINKDLIDYLEKAADNFLNHPYTRSLLINLLLGQSQTSVSSPTCSGIPILGDACINLTAKDVESEASTDRNEDGVCTGPEPFQDLNENDVWDMGETFTDLPESGYDHDNNPFTANGYYDPGELYVDDPKGDYGLYRVGGIQEQTDGASCTPESLFLDRNRNGVMDTGDNLVLDIEGEVELEVDLGSNGRADTLEDALAGENDDGLCLSITISGLSLDIVMDMPRGLDGCGDDGVCSNHDDTPDIFLKMLRASGVLSIPRSGEEGTPSQLKATACLTVASGDFLARFPWEREGTEVGVILKRLEMEGGLEVSLDPDDEDESLSSALVSIIPYLEIPTLSYVTFPYDPELDEYMFHGLPILDINEVFDKAVLAHPLVPGGEIRLIPSLSMVLRATVDEKDGTPDGLILYGGADLGVNYTISGGISSAGGCITPPPSAMPLAWKSPLYIPSIDIPSFGEYSLGICLHQNILSRLVYEAFISDLICIRLDEDVPLLNALVAELKFDLFNTDTFINLNVIPGLKRDFPGLPMRFRLGPSMLSPGGSGFSNYEDTPFVLAGGTDIEISEETGYGNVRPALTIHLPRIRLDTQVDVDSTGNWQDVIGMVVGLGVKLGLSIDRDTSCSECTRNTMAPRLTIEGSPHVDNLLWYDENWIGAVTPGESGEDSYKYEQIEGFFSQLIVTLLTTILKADILPRIDLSNIGLGDPDGDPPTGLVVTTAYVGGVGEDSDAGEPDPEAGAVDGDTLGLFLDLKEDIDADPATDNTLSGTDIWRLLCQEWLLGSIQGSSENQLITAIRKVCLDRGLSPSRHISGMTLAGAGTIVKVHDPSWPPLYSSTESGLNQSRKDVVGDAEYGCQEADGDPVSIFIYLIITLVWLLCIRVYCWMVGWFK